MNGMAHNDRMTARRVVVLVTCVVVAGLAGLFSVNSWTKANQIATVVSALVGAAALGVAVLTTWHVHGSGPRALRTGRASATGAGSSANTGIRGRSVRAGAVHVERSGDAHAADGGEANSGAELP